MYQVQLPWNVHNNSQSSLDSASEGSIRAEGGSQDLKDLSAQEQSLLAGSHWGSLTLLEETRVAKSKQTKAEVPIFSG